MTARQISEGMCALHTHFALKFTTRQACGIHTNLKKSSTQNSRNILGDRVREARMRFKPALSQDDLAGRLAKQGIVLDRSAISRIEGRARYVMDYEIKALAKSLKVSVAWLFGEG